MRTQMISRWSLGMAAAFLMAMTSTLSAQAMSGKPDVPAVSSSVTSGAELPFTQIRPIYGPGHLTAVPLVSGWCGTDTSVLDGALRARIHLQLVAALIASGTSVFPGSIATKVAAFRRWYSSTIDVLPG